MSGQKPATPAPNAGAPWVLPDEPVAVRLINTIWLDRNEVRDALETPADLEAWLQVTGLSDRPVGKRDLDDARRLREALRQLAVRVTGDARSRPMAGITEPEAIAVIDQVRQAAPMTDHLVLTPEGVALQSVVDAPPIAAALAAVARDGVALLTDPARALHACHAPCVLFFVQDHPRRRWCSPGCSNRARAARHYERSKSRSAPTPRVD